VVPVLPFFLQIRDDLFIPFASFLNTRSSISHSLLCNCAADSASLNSVLTPTDRRDAMVGISLYLWGTGFESKLGDLIEFLAAFISVGAVDKC
jgi:hypothetical protein